MGAVRTEMTFCIILIRRSHVSRPPKNVDIPWVNLTSRRRRRPRRSRAGRKLTLAMPVSVAYISSIAARIMLQNLPSFSMDKIGRLRMRIYILPSWLFNEDRSYLSNPYLYKLFFLSLAYKFFKQVEVNIFLAKI